MLHNSEKSYIIPAFPAATLNLPECSMAFDHSWPSYNRCSKNTTGGNGGCQKRNNLSTDLLEIFLDKIILKKFQATSETIFANLFAAW